MQKGNSLVTAIKHLQPAFLLFVRLAQAWSFINKQMKAMVNLSILRIATHDAHDLAWALAFSLYELTW